MSLLGEFALEIETGPLRSQAQANAQRIHSTSGQILPQLHVQSKLSKLRTVLHLHRCVGCGGVWLFSPDTDSRQRDGIVRRATPRRVGDRQPRASRELVKANGDFVIARRHL